MEIGILDFFSGLFLMNAMAHYIIGMCNIRFLGLFGYSGPANIYYGYLCFVISLALFHLQHGLADIKHYPLYAGAVIVIVIYFMAMKALMNYFSKNGNKVS